MENTPYNNKQEKFIIADQFVKIKYLRDSNSGRIKKGQIAMVSKSNANHLVRYKIAILV